MLTSRKKLVVILPIILLMTVFIGCSGTPGTGRDSGDGGGGNGGGGDTPPEDEQTDDIPDRSAYAQNAVFQVTCDLPAAGVSLATDESAIAFSGDLPLKTEGIYGCVGVVIYAQDDSGRVVFSLAHFNAPDQAQLLAQRDAVITAGGRAETIESYAAAGSCYECSPTNWTVIRYADDINLQSTAFNLFGDGADDEQTTMIDMVATAEKVIYVRKRSDCSP